jgi:hypothetical protein
MIVSINPNIVGKPAKGSNVNLGYGWHNIEADWSDIFKLITEDGYATSAELSSDNRKEANFVSRQLLMVDIDSGMTIPELLDNDFYNCCGAGFYATPSFTPELHKFRICFILEQPETDVNRLRKINRGLLKVFAQADEACKDPCRLFYGTPDCVFYEQTDKILTLDIVEQLVEIIDIADTEAAESMTRTEYTGPVELDDFHRTRIIDLLKQTYVGNYTMWRNIGWGLKSGGFSLQDFQYITTGMMSQKSATDAANVWRDGGQVSRPVTMGSVIHFIKQRHGDDALKETRTTRQVGHLYKTAELAAQKWLKD